MAADGGGFALPSGAAAGLVYIGTTPTGSARERALSNIAKRERSVPRAAVRPSKVITAEEQRRKRLGKMKQNVITSARLHVEEAARGGFRGKWAMLTLTYRDEERWVADQVGMFLDALRVYCKRAGFAARYTWVLELTKRGRPHYHVLVWLPKGRTLPKPDKQGWWKLGLTRIEWARNAVGYLAKYASKGDDYDLRTLPRGARLSGFGGLNKTSRIELRWWKLPGWLRDQWNSICDVGRIKGGYVNRETGEFLASPFLVIFLGGALILCEVIP